MKKIFTFNLIGVVLFSIGCAYSIFISIKTIISYCLVYNTISFCLIYNSVVLMLFSLIEITGIIYLFYVVKSIWKNKINKINIIISIFFTLIVAIIVYLSSSNVTILETYSIMSWLGIINTWYATLLNPTAITRIGGVFIIIPNIILLLKKSAYKHE